MRLPNWIGGLGSLFFPRLCLGCQRVLPPAQTCLCATCELEMPLADNWKYAENALTERLAGRLPLQFAAAAYTFRDGTVCQRVIHALKYYNRPDIGTELGRHFGELIAPSLTDVDGLVPVPIHRKRRHERGYNQAEAIATGLGEALDKPVLAGALRRRSFRGSQTKRSALERLENVRDSFTVGRGDFRNQHLLLVDDVMTTGATLDFCGNILLDAHEGLRLSVVTLAVAE